MIKECKNNLSSSLCNNLQPFSDYYKENEAWGIFHWHFVSMFLFKNVMIFKLDFAKIMRKKLHVQTRNWENIKDILLGLKSDRPK